MKFWLCSVHYLKMEPRKMPAKNRKENHFKNEVKKWLLIYSCAIIKIWYEHIYIRNSLCWWMGWKEETDQKKRKRPVNDKELKVNLSLRWMIKLFLCSKVITSTDSLFTVNSITSNHSAHVKAKILTKLASSFICEMQYHITTSLQFYVHIDINYWYSILINS